MSSDIFVFDDIVPEWLYRSIKTNILSIPVTCQHHGVGPDVGNAFFSKIWPLFGLHEIPWEYKATFAALNDSRDKLSNDDEVLPLHFVQCQLNLTTKTLVGGVHADMGPPAWTMVHFISGDTGMDFWTDFPDHGGEKICDIDYKDNRCVIFPSNLWHRGVPTNDVEPRVTLGYIFGGPPQSEHERNNNIISPIFKKQWSEKYKKLLEENK
jgi:hypothetical protein